MLRVGRGERIGLARAYAVRREQRGALTDVHLCRQLLGGFVQPAVSETAGRSVCLCLGKGAEEGAGFSRRQHG